MDSSNRYQWKSPPVYNGLSLNIKHEQTVQIQIRMLLEGLSDQALSCLSFNQMEKIQVSLWTLTVLHSEWVQ